MSADINTINQEYTLQNQLVFKRTCLWYCRCRDRQPIGHGHHKLVWRAGRQLVPEASASHRAMGLKAYESHTMRVIYSVENL